MSTLSVWRFPIPDGAEVMLNSLEVLEKQQLITVLDGAVVTWEVGAKRPKTRQMHNMAGAGALGGAFWGMLFGLLFFIPFLGLAVGAAAGALGGAFTDVGIDDKFIEQIRREVTPGTSALFLLSQDAVLDKVRPAIADLNLNPQLISTNLSREQEEKLRETLTEG
ncbi:MAG TPA: DUF1269 domain-containing protein [Actinocrinis sp.]|nr:DUF1269 domain-containing protein [Actinocrinis sp.]